MIRFVTFACLALLTVGVVALPAGNANPVVGSTYDGYFTYNADGYYYYGNAAYSRYLVSNPGYYSYSYGYPTYYPGSSYWKYTRVYQPTYSAPAVPTYSTGWKSEVLKYAQARDDMELYHKTLGALGINGQSYSFQSNSYYSRPAYLNYTPQGATQYGYTSVQQAREAYGINVDVNKLAQISGQMAQGMLSATSQANSEANEVIGHGERVAEVLAKGEAAAKVLQAVRPDPSAASVTTTTTTGATVGTGNGGGAGAGFVVGATPGNGDVKAFVANVAVPACGGCHSAGGENKTKFTVTEWAALTPEKKAAVYERLTSTDPKMRMPRLPNGEPGALTKEQLIEFVRH